MSDLGFLGEIKGLRGNGIAGKCLKRQWRDKFHRPAGHNDLHFEPGSDQDSDEFNRLVTGDSATDAQDNHTLFFGAAHVSKIADLQWGCKLLLSRQILHTG